MKVAYLDTIGGIAGDMTLSAFVSAGLSLDDLMGELRKLPLEGFELIGSHVQRNGIDAVHIEVGRVLIKGRSLEKPVCHSTDFVNEGRKV